MDVKHERDKKQWGGDYKIWGPNNYQDKLGIYSVEKTVEQQVGESGEK